MNVINRLLATSFMVCIIMCACTGNQQHNNFKSTLVEQQIDSTGYYISLPPGYSLTSKIGPDFSVYYFAPTDTTDKKSFHGGIYIGGYPNRFSPPGISCTTSTVTSSILNTDAQWTVYKCDSNYSVQTLVEGIGVGGNDKLHAFGDATSGDGMQKVLDIYGTLIKRK